MSKESAIECVKELSAVWGALTGDKLNAYIKYLSDIPSEMLETATTSVIATYRGQTFPPIAVIRAEAMPLGYLLKEIRRAPRDKVPDVPRCLEAEVERLGGWGEVRAMDVERLERRWMR